MPLLAWSIAQARWFPWSLAVGVPLLLLGAVDSVLLDLEAGERFTGVFRRDYLYYAANAREVIENGRGVFYGDPFAWGFDSPRVFTHLELWLLGWSWKLTGLSLPVLWQVFQVLFGTAMLVALYELLAHFFAPEERSFAFATVVLGGGFAALQAFVRSAGGEAGGSLLGVYDVMLHEVSGVGWFPNVFQNVLLTTQSFYHALALGTLAALLARRQGWVLVGVSLTWWSHPFTGLELGGIVGAYALLDGALRRDRALLRLAAGVFAVSAIFLFYNLWWIPRASPEAADILGRWRRAQYLFRLGFAPGMWGVFLLGPLLAVAQCRGLQEAGDRLLVAWIAVVALLLLHDRLLPESIRPFQPIHFAHGYMYLPLAILTLRAGFRLSRSWPPRLRASAGALLLAVAMLDNAAFTAQLARSSERPVLSSEVAPIVAALEREQAPGIALVLGRVPLLRDFLCVATPHRLFLYNPFQTPYYEAKRRVAQRVTRAAEPARVAASHGIRWLVAPAPQLAFASTSLAKGELREVLSSGPYRVLEVALPIEQPRGWSDKGPLR